MHRSTVVGYSFNADTYCDDCMRTIAIRQALNAGSATMWGDSGTAEQTVGEWASMVGIDRFDERSYDSSEFPKVVFADSAHAACMPENGYESGQCADRCAQCHNSIGFDCPNIDE